MIFIKSILKYWNYKIKFRSLVYISAQTGKYEANSIIKVKLGLSIIRDSQSDD